MKAIVAVDINWGIGYEGNLLQRIPEDMKNFKRITLGKVVIMGRETYESLPGRKPLKDRVNIILSRNADLHPEGFIVCHSLGELLDSIKIYNRDDVFVIGGEQVYRLLLPYCDEAFVTRINKAFTADKYFVRLDEDNNWKRESQGESKSHNDVEFCFTVWRNGNWKALSI